MSESLGGKGIIQKIFRGAFDYLKGKDIYSEEIFEVFKNVKIGSYRFESTVYGRVSTGEMLTIKVSQESYVNGIPILTVVEKILGNQNSQESYLFDSKEGILFYQFKNGEDVHSYELPISFKFHIATPAICSSTSFIRCKKFSNTSKNIYNILVSQNQWKYEAPPQITGASLEKISPNKEPLRINGNNLQAYRYKFCHEELKSSAVSANATSEKISYLSMHLSGHLYIPYLVETIPLNDDYNSVIRIQTKYLNKLNDNDQ